MLNKKTIYSTKNGGSITCFKSKEGRLFQACLSGHCLYSDNLHSAKVNLKCLESKTKILSGKRHLRISKQRNSTLKWRSDGELTSIDMARILQLLEPQELTICEFSCDIKQTDVL